MELSNSGRLVCTYSKAQISTGLLYCSLGPGAQYLRPYRYKNTDPLIENVMFDRYRLYRGVCMFLKFSATIGGTVTVLPYFLNRFPGSVIGFKKRGEDRPAALLANSWNSSGFNNVSQIIAGKPTDAQI
eukprot:GHVP01041226.1.p1 GENE.GHVP01041226.1~~GHVP01041226.1.p1  ORF type:complete len:129 (+),score=8.85 GHVP01041226.1:524-910(+)